MKNEWTSSYVNANGIRLHYTRTPANGPVVVLAHGLSDNGLCWLRLARELEADYELVMLDARGHGLSDAPETGYAPSDHGHDISEAIRKLGLERPTLIGHSMGASSAAIAAASNPAAVKALILEDPPWQKIVGSPNREFLEEWRRQEEERQKRAVEEIAAEGREICPLWDDAEYGPWAEAKKQLSLNIFSWSSEDDIENWRETAKSIQCPVLLATADSTKGAIVTPEIADEVSRLCPETETVYFPKAGHNIRRESFEEFAAAVRKFLAALR